MTLPDPLFITPLGKHHDRAAFSCGVDVLDAWLRARAGQDVRRRLARVFVCCKEGSSAVLGFYTLSSLSVDVSSLPEDRARKLPGLPVPATLIGGLAVSRDAQGQGVGRLLLADAVKRTLAASEEVAIHALVVDAKDDRARQFYESFGFIRLADRNERLFLPLASRP